MLWRGGGMPAFRYGMRKVQTTAASPIRPMTQ
jgi:hypothetical protein